jgi:hypothetical protein
MQKESIGDLSNLSLTENFSVISKEEGDSYSQKKRRRGGKPKSLTKKEEDRILKYALKLSEKEYQMKSNNENLQQNKIKYSEIETCNIFNAQEEDFINPISYFEKLWNEDSTNTGIIKVIPPTSWVNKQKENFNKIYATKLQDQEKKLFTRKQTLNELRLAKVIINIILSILIYLVCKSNFSLNYSFKEESLLFINF